MHYGMKLRTTVNKEWLLDKLKDNRNLHQKCYMEARDGYIDQAQRRLNVALQKLRDGRAVGLHFDLHVPDDHTKDYDTVIAMIEAHIEDTVELNSAEFRMFVEDEWDWSDQWLISNAGYSGTAADYARFKGLM